MIKVDVFFTKSNSIWSKLIYYFYKLFYKQTTKYTHCGLLFDDKIFEIDDTKKSGFYDRKLGKHTTIHIGNIQTKTFNKIIKKFNGLTYDLGEIFLLMINISKSNIDNKYICSTLVANILKDINKINGYNYETLNPDELFTLLKKDYK